jgi:hypothetical protein
MTGKHRLLHSSFYQDAIALIADKLQAKNQTEPTFFIFSHDMNSVIRKFSMEAVVEYSVPEGSFNVSLAKIMRSSKMNKDDSKCVKDAKLELFC